MCSKIMKIIYPGMLGVLVLSILVITGIFSWQGYKNLENRTEEFEQYLAALESKLVKINKDVLEREAQLERPRLELAVFRVGMIKPAAGSPFASLVAVGRNAALVF